MIRAPLEDFKNLFMFSGGNANTIIFYSKLPGRIRARGTDDYVGIDIWLTVFNGVTDEVLKDLDKIAHVAGNSWQLLGNLNDSLGCIDFQFKVAENLL